MLETFTSLPRRSPRPHPQTVRGPWLAGLLQILLVGQPELAPFGAELISTAIWKGVAVRDILGLVGGVVALLHRLFQMAVRR